MGITRFMYPSNIWAKFYELDFSGAARGTRTPDHPCFSKNFQFFEDTLRIKF